MPTHRPRHVITETDEVARALDIAAERWPDVRPNRTRLLVRLVEEGSRAVAQREEEAAARRREAIARTSGALSGLYGPGYLNELRRDWPA